MRRSTSSAARSARLKASRRRSRCSLSSRKRRVARAYSAAVVITAFLLIRSSPPRAIASALPLGRPAQARLRGALLRLPPLLDVGDHVRDLLVAPVGADGWHHEAALPDHGGDLRVGVVPGVHGAVQGWDAGARVAGARDAVAGGAVRLVRLLAAGDLLGRVEIGRASCRERGEIAVGDVSLKKKIC